MVLRTGNLHYSCRKLLTFLKKGAVDKMIAHFFTAPFVLGEYGLAFGKSLFCFRALGSRLAHDNIAVRKNVPSIQRRATAIAGYIERPNHSAATQRIMANAPPSQLRNKFNPQQSKKPLSILARRIWFSPFLLIIYFLIDSFNCFLTNQEGE